jgi:type III secretion protein T
MIGTLEVAQLQHLLLACVLALPRMMVCMFLVPVFGGWVVPRAMRIPLALALALPVLFRLSQQIDASCTGFAVAALVAKETFLGLVLGTVLSLPFWAIMQVGTLLDQQRGAQNSAEMTPMGHAGHSPIGAALQQAMIVLLAVNDGLTPLYQLLLDSYQAWPVMSSAPNLSGVDAATLFACFSEFTRLALLYAAPVLGSMLLIDFAFALIGLAAPSLPTYFAAMPVKSVIGMYIVAAYLWTLIDHSGAYLGRAIDFAQGLMHG